MSAIERGNAARRQRAQQAGQATYAHEVVDQWPACVDCGQTIRHRSGSGGYRDRSCGCPDAAWWCGPGGWERRTVAP